MKNKHIFLILFLLNLLNYIDRQVLYSVFPLLQKDLFLTDLQLGTLASAFMAVYMCYAPLVGYFADRTSRPKWIGSSALIWSGATLLCAYTNRFATLLGARGLLGVGEGGFTTIAQPFLAEFYPKEKHALILAKFGLALPLGGALGYILGGAIGQTWGWRVAFMAVSIPGILLSLFVLRIPDKSRQQTTVKIPFKNYVQILKNKPFLSVCIAHAMITFLIGGCSAWMPTYLFRYLDLDVAKAGTYFGALVIVSGLIGTYAGGKLAEIWKRHTVNAYYYMIMLAFAGCILPIWGGLCVQHITGALLCFGLAIFFLFLPTGAIAAALVDTTPSAMRSMAFAINIFIIHLLGDTLSPTVIGGASTIFSLKTALLLCTIVVIPGLWAAWAARTN